MDVSTLLDGLDPITQGILVLCLVAVTGLFFGRARLGTVSLGIGGVLFAGILWGHLGLQVDPEVGHFLREFGLILFVYTIGIQVGPGFFSALKRSGLALNGMAAAMVALSMLVAAALHMALDLPVPVMLGLLSGATTNTPSLGAATQMLTTVGAGPEALGTPGLGYAVAYPFGIAGILLTMLLVRAVLRIRVDREQEAFEAERAAARKDLDTVTLEIANPNMEGLALGDLPGLKAMGIVVSRVMRDGVVQVAQPETPVKMGDVLLLVGRPRKLRDMVRILGHRVDTDLKAVPSEVKWRRLVVTRSSILGKTIGDLDVLQRYDAVISRVTRAGIELTPSAKLRLQFGDICTVIGQPANLDGVARVLGDREQALLQAQILPIFLGIALGVLLGSIPLMVPGMPAPVKLGLAGGPLLAAILLARLGHLGPFVWFMPPSANHILREIGIVLFLGIVGLKAGESFVAILTEGDGLSWLLYGAIITLVPLLIVGFFARLVMRMNYLTLCGLLAGGMTDPPALAFANAIRPSEAPALAYATVYPLVMVLRILAPQILVLLFWV
ncbi:putative transporter [Roseospira visakhapatnamensis]|uniref:Putative transport protein n=1 Tax=Roseospira visakhapatnamensis TaxID=390880 RepID=A0A7W6RDK1_9PROT|nr:putative transporter [Roseospira visakhapatnamensis]MBB4266528.1 putative transport protein [Roseospira visakhapatnamensis]